MQKRKYQKPNVEIVYVDANSILVGSTGATGEDIPWAANERHIFYDEDDNWDNEEDRAIF